MLTNSTITSIFCGNAATGGVSGFAFIAHGAEFCNGHKKYQGRGTKGNTLESSPIVDGAAEYWRNRRLPLVTRGMIDLLMGVQLCSHL